MRLIRNAIIAFFLLVFGWSCGINGLFEYASSMKKAGDAYVRGDYEGAESNYVDALRSAELRDDKVDIITALGYLARLHAVQKKNDIAEKEFQQRISIADSSEVPTGLLAECYVDLVMFYLRNHHCEQAKEVLFRVRKNTSVTDAAAFKESTEMISAYAEFKQCQIRFLD